MVRAPRPDIVPPGWQLQLIDMLAHVDEGVEPVAHACGGGPHEWQNDPLFSLHAITQQCTQCHWYQMRDACWRELHFTVNQQKHAFLLMIMMCCIGYIFSDIGQVVTRCTEHTYRVHLLISKIV